jgi:hypothetical protein
MGAKNPDLIAPPPSPIRELTLADMAARRTILIADCPTCRARTHVDLSALRRLLGDDYVLWGRRARCKTWVRWEVDRRCPGRVRFYGAGSVTGSARELTMSGEVQSAIDLRSQEAQAWRP